MTITTQTPATANGQLASLALVQAIQQLLQRVAELEDRVTELENV